MVWSLDELKNVEDRKLLGGRVALLLEDHNRAQSLYLQSSAPEEALNMRRDLLQVPEQKSTFDQNANSVFFSRLNSKPFSISVGPGFAFGQQACARPDSLHFQGVRPAAGVHRQPC